MHNDKNSTIDDPVAQQQARRRMLRLGAAAPMVLTLVPGSSFAASTLQCLQRQSAADNARGELAPMLSESADRDEWVRAQVDVFNLFDPNQDGAQIPGQYVLSSDGQMYWRVDSGGAMNAPLIASAKSTPRLSAGSNGELGKAAPSADGQYTPTSVTADKIDTRWALIKVDPTTGEPKGYSWEPQAANGTLVSNGCFLSMNPNAQQYSGGFGSSLTSYVRSVLGLT